MGLSENVIFHPKSEFATAPWEGFDNNSSLFRPFADRFWKNQLHANVEPDTSGELLVTLSVTGANRCA